MKNHTLRKTIAMVMAATMMFSVVGCGKKENKGKEEKKDTKNMVYEGKELALEGIEGDISTFVIKGDRIYLNTYQWAAEVSGEEKEETETSEEEAVSTEESSGDVVIEESSSEEVKEEEKASEEESSEESADEKNSEEETTEEGELSKEEAEALEEELEAVAGTDIVRLYSMNLDGSDLRELPLPEFSKNEYMNYMSVNDDESILMLLNSYDEKTEKNSFYLCKIDKDGKELFKEDVTKSLNIDPEQSYISQMVCDETGRIILSTDSEVFMFDENVKLLGSVKADFYIEGMAKTKEGKIICAHSDEKEGAVVQELDIDGKKWGEVQKVEVSYWGGSGSLMDGVDYDFYYRQDSGIFGYDLKAKKSTQLMDFVASNMTSENSWGIVPVAKDKFMGTSYEDGAEGMKLMVYSKVDPSTIADKKTITFGSIYMDESMKRAAIAFNKQSKDYQIEFITYEDEEDPLAKMNAEIAAGNIPDILDLGFGSAEMYEAKGLLEDLLPYIEKDKELSTEDFLPTVFEAMKTGDKLYTITPAFSITTLIGRTKEVGKEIGWTFEDMKTLIEEKKGSARPFLENYKTSLLWSFAYTFDEFVDWQTGECSFDSKEFKEILELCNTGENGEPEYTDEERDYV